MFLYFLVIVQMKAAGEKGFDAGSSGKDTGRKKTILKDFLVSLEDVYIIHFDISYIMYTLCCVFITSTLFDKLF